MQRSKMHARTAMHHSVTSSARARSAGGSAMPIAFTVLRLMTSSNFVDCSTGRSAGFAPFRIFAIWLARTSPISSGPTNEVSVFYGTAHVVRPA
jgi:hypothetical protein